MKKLRGPNQYSYLGRDIEVIRYSYICIKRTYYIETMMLPLHKCMDGVERLWNDHDNIWISLGELDKTKTASVKYPIYLTKRDDELVFNHWRKLLNKAKDECYERIARLDEYLETL